MNIVFTRFPLESTYGGAEVQTLSLMKGLKERGHNILFLGGCPILCNEITNHQIPITKIDIGPPPVTKWSAVSFLWRKKMMQKTLIESVQKRQTLGYKLQAIVMLSLSEKLLLTPWALRQGIRVFWIEHDRIGRWLRWNPWLPILRKLAKQVTTIVVSQLSRKIYLDLGWPAENTIAIPNGIEIKNILTPSPCLPAVALAKAGPSPQGGGYMLHIGCIARLTPDKGIDLLIDAIADIPDIELTILGRGPEEGYLRKLIEERNLAHRVHMKSWFNNIADFYSVIDSLVLPSREHDPFGLVAAEAMSYGIPVIVTDTCGIAGYLHNGVDAVIISANSSLALKEAINRILNSEYRMSIAREGQKTARRKFSLEKMIDAYEQLLVSPLPEGVPPPEGEDEGGGV